MDSQKIEVFLALVIASTLTVFFGQIASLCLIAGWTFHHLASLWEKKK